MKCGSMKGLQNAAQILLVCIPVQAQAVDYSSCPCVAGLIPDIHIDNADVRSRAYLRDVMCQLDFTEFQHKYGAEAGATTGSSAEMQTSTKLIISLLRGSCAQTELRRLTHLR